MGLYPLMLIRNHWNMHIISIYCIWHFKRIHQYISGFVNISISDIATCTTLFCYILYYVTNICSISCGNIVLFIAHACMNWELNNNTNMIKHYNHYIAFLVLPQETSLLCQSDGCITGVQARLHHPCYPLLNLWVPTQEKGTVNTWLRDVLTDSSKWNHNRREKLHECTWIISCYICSYLPLVDSF